MMSASQELRIIDHVMTYILTEHSPIIENMVEMLFLELGQTKRSPTSEPAVNESPLN